MRNLLISTVSAAVLSLGLCVPAEASYLAFMHQSGTDVVATGTGSLDLAGLSLYISGATVGAGLLPHSGEIDLGPTPQTSIDLYRFISGPGNFGPGFVTSADTGVGPAVGVVAIDNWLVVPQGYVSGTPLGTSTNLFINQTYASMGVTPGIYTWTWGSGADADSFTLAILPGGPSVPEPLTLSLFGAGLAGAAGLRRRRDKKA